MGKGDEIMFPDDKRYIGTIRDTSNELPTYSTKSYETHQEAYDAAVKMKKKHDSSIGILVAKRYEIKVIPI